MPTPDRMNRLSRLLLGRLRLVLVLVPFLTAGWLGHRSGFVAAAIAYLAFTVVASQFVFEVYDLSDRWQAFVAFLSYVFTLGYPEYRVSDGEIISKHLRSLTSLIGGPGLVAVDSVSAAVVVGRGQVKMIGSGMHMLRRGYRLQGAVDLRQQSSTYQLDKVFTRDGIPLTVLVTVLYRIIQGEGILVRQARYEPSTPAVVKAVLATRDWKAQTGLLAKAIVRDVIAAFNLDSLLGVAETGEIPSDGLQSLHRAFGLSSELVPRVPLQEELRSRIDTETGRWGVEILKVTLDEIRLPDQAMAQLLAAWGVHWTDVVKSQEADIDARAAVRSAEGKREAAEIEAKAITTTALAEASAIRMRGEAAAQAQAELYRQTLAALQPLGRSLRDEDLEYLARALILKDIESLEQQLKARAGSASSAGPEQG